MKTNKSCYNITVCASIIEGDNVDRDVCQWRRHASVPKSSGGYFKIRSYVGENTCSQPLLISNHRKATTSFVCSVILPMEREKNLDMSYSYIIEYIEAKYHNDIQYTQDME